MSPRVQVVYIHLQQLELILHNIRPAPQGKSVRDWKGLWRNDFLPNVVNCDVEYDWDRPPGEFRYGCMSRRLFCRLTPVYCWDYFADWQEYFSQLKDTTGALPCHIHLPACLWIMDPHSRAPKKNTSHGNGVLPQDTTHLIQRPCYQQGRTRRDPAGNWTTRRFPDNRKKTQTAVVWWCFPFIRSGKTHLARHSERGKKTRQTEEEVGGQHQGMDRPGVRQVPEGSGEQGKNGGNWLQNHLWCPNDPRG